jgi:hypothetical protein
VSRRRVEVIVAGTAIVASAAFTAAVLLWHFGLDDVWWSLPRFPAGDEWNGFELYAWADLIFSTAVVAVSLSAGFLFATGRKRLASSSLPLTLAIVVAAGCAAVYWPFLSLYVYRTDRIRGLVKEPAIAYRTLVGFLVATLVMSLLYLAVASLRRAPPLTRKMAPVTLAVLVGVYLHIIWIPIVLPISNDWEPVNWERPDLLTTFRPCRGAVLWFRRYDKIIPFARIDDLWLHFADPRHGGSPSRAISVTMGWREGYAWLRPEEASSLLIRRDDPAVTRCDGHWRADRVAPASWHKLGINW